MKKQLDGEGNSVSYYDYITSLYDSMAKLKLFGSNALSSRKSVMPKIKDPNFIKDFMELLKVKFLLNKNLETQVLKKITQVQYIHDNDNNMFMPLIATMKDRNKEFKQVLQKQKMAERKDLNYFSGYN